MGERAVRSGTPRHGCDAALTTERLKVMTIVGTRPEIIRLSRTICALDAAMDHVLLHTGQNHDRELNAIFFDELELRAPDYNLDAAGETPAETIGRMIIGADRILADEQPDAVLVLGDTDSCLAAIAAKRRRIPVFHMEAGNRCFDERVPEEINRRIVDHSADINLPYSSIAREYLLSEGFPADRIIKTGSPLFEVLNHYRPKIDRSDVLSRLEVEGGRLFPRQCASRGKCGFGRARTKACRRPRRGCGAIWQPDPREHASSNAQTHRRASSRVPPACAIAEAVRLHRL